MDVVEIVGGGRGGGRGAGGRGGRRRGKTYYCPKGKCFDYKDPRYTHAIC